MKTYENKVNSWDRIMMAITFAEAGEPETVRNILDLGIRKQSEIRPETRNRPELRVR